MIDKEKIKRLLGNGADSSMVAQMVGCQPGYISQLMEDEGFAAEVVAARYAKAAKYQDHDDALDKLEDSIIEKLETSLSFCFKPELLMRALQIVNGAKRRAINAEAANGSVQGTVVQLTLPPVIINQIRLNGNGEVVQVGQRELVTLDANGFNRLAEQHVPLARRLAGIVGGVPGNERQEYVINGVQDDSSIGPNGSSAGQSKAS